MFFSFSKSFSSGAKIHLKRRKRNAPPITNISARWVNEGRPVGEDADDNSLANIAASVRFPETP